MASLSLLLGMVVGRVMFDIGLSHATRWVERRAEVRRTARDEGWRDG